MLLPCIIVTLGMTKNDIFTRLWTTFHAIQELLFTFLKIGSFLQTVNCCFGCYTLQMTFIVAAGG